MRLFVFSVFVILCGCAGTSEQVGESLARRFDAQSVDAMILAFGPPNSTFPMAGGGAVYQWELANHTNIATNEYGGSAKTLYCRVRAIVDASKIVQSVSTEDASNVFGESLCAERLGIIRTAEP